MKRIFIIVLGLLILSSCATSSHCDAYGSIEKIDSEEVNS